MKSTILIVEDEESQRKILSDYLNKRGFETIEARDGVEGLEAAISKHPDLILLDIRMPRMDGMTMMHKLREDSWGKKAAIVILTNYDTSDTHLFQIILDEPAFYLVKSNSSLDAIFEKLQELINSKNQEKSQKSKIKGIAAACLCFVIQSIK